MKIHFSRGNCKSSPSLLELILQSLSLQVTAHLNTSENIHSAFHNLSIGLASDEEHYILGALAWDPRKKKLVFMNDPMCSKPINNYAYCRSTPQSNTSAGLDSYQCFTYLIAKPMKSDGSLTESFKRQREILHEAASKYAEKADVTPEDMAKYVNGFSGDAANVELYVYHVPINDVVYQLNNAFSEMRANNFKVSPVEEISYNALTKIKQSFPHQMPLFVRFTADLNTRSFPNLRVTALPPNQDLCVTSLPEYFSGVDTPHSVTYRNRFLALFNKLGELYKAYTCGYVSQGSYNAGSTSRVLRFVDKFISERKKMTENSEQPYLSFPVLKQIFHVIPAPFLRSICDAMPVDHKRVVKFSEVTLSNLDSQIDKSIMYSSDYSPLRLVEAERFIRSVIAGASEPAEIDPDNKALREQYQQDLKG